MNKYDCIVIGGGWGGIAFALLYAMSGKKVAIFESNDRLGGYGHCFTKNDYEFCTDMHYFFETQPGGMVDLFLKKIGLDKEIEFNSLDANGYDRIVIGDYSFDIPIGLENYRNKLIEHFPTYEKSINKVFKLADDLNFVQQKIREKNPVQNLWNHPSELLNFIKYFATPANKFFDDLAIDGDLKALFLGRVGNLGMLPSKIPFLMLLLELSLYTTSATFPKKGMNHFINCIQDKLLENKVDIFLNSTIKKINLSSQKVTSITDNQDKEFFADLYVSNADPQMTLTMCNHPIPMKFKYQYTCSCFSLYIGLKNIQSADFSLGKFNTWLYKSNQTEHDCRKVLNDLDYDYSFIFASFPSAYSNNGAVSPPNSHTVQIVLPANYYKISNLYTNENTKYNELVAYVKELTLSKLSKKVIPNIEKHIDVVEIFSPIDLMNKVKTPNGAMYGMCQDTRKMLWPIGNSSPFANLYFVGATAFHPGLGPVLQSAMNLYEKLSQNSD